MLALAARALAFEPVPSGAQFFNRSGVQIPIESLRFTHAGWHRGRDQGFAFALQRNTSYFYLWIRGNDGGPVGKHLLCDGNLVDTAGENLAVERIKSFTLADLTGKGSIWMVGVADSDQRLLGWNLSSCHGQGTVPVAAQFQTPTGLDRFTIRGDVIAGDFDGTGNDMVEVINPETGEMLQWSMGASGWHLNRRAILTISPTSNAPIHGIKYVGTTRLPHDTDNTAYENAAVILHDKGYTIARNEKSVAFSPNCIFQPEVCRNKTLLFNLDQGFSDGLQDLTQKDRAQADTVLDRVIAALRPLQIRFMVWALIDPIYENRDATIFILDKLAAANIPFVLDYYSSDVSNLAYIKKNWLDYTPKAFAALKGVSLDIHGANTSPDNLDYYANRYGAAFVGIRFMERLGIDINAKDPNGQPMIADQALAKQELSFDWQLAAQAVKWANDAGKYVLWADPALYLPYVCYENAATVQLDTSNRDDYVRRETQLARQYGAVIPMYDNNEGLKLCGVVYGNWLMTPRNFRLLGWQRIPEQIAASKHGGTPLTGPNGFGLSVQSWTSDYDPILTAGTLPAEEMAIWTLDGFAKGASVIEYEPYFYFFAWPPSQGLTQSVPLGKGQYIGDRRNELAEMLRDIGLGGVGINRAGALLPVAAFRGADRRSGPTTERAPGTSK